MVGFSAADQFGLALRVRGGSMAWRDRIGRRWERLRAQFPAAPPALLLTLAAGVATAGLLLWRARPRSPASPVGAPTVPFYTVALRRLRRAGFLKPPATTPAEFAEQVVQQGGEAFLPLRELTRAYYAAHFGGVRLPPEMVTRLLALARTLPRRPSR